MGNRRCSAHLGQINFFGRSKLFEERPDSIGDGSHALSITLRIGSFFNGENMIERFSCVVCGTVVIIFAPIGAIFASIVEPQVISYLLYIVQLASITGTISIVQPWNYEMHGSHTAELTIFSLFVLMFGIQMFQRLQDVGLILMQRSISQEMSTTNTTEKEIDANKWEWQHYNTDLNAQLLPELSSLRSLIACEDAKAHLALFAKRFHMVEQVNFGMSVMSLKTSVHQKMQQIGETYMLFADHDSSNVEYTTIVDSLVAGKCNDVRLFDVEVNKLAVHLEKARFLRKFKKSKFGRDYIWRKTIAMEAQNDGSNDDQSTLSPTRRASIGDFTPIAEP